MSHRPSLNSIHIDSSYLDSHHVEVSAPSGQPSMNSLLSRDRDNTSKSTGVSTFYEKTVGSLPAAAGSLFRKTGVPGVAPSLKAKQSNYHYNGTTDSNEKINRSFNLNQLLSKKNSVFTAAISFMFLFFLFLQWNYQNLDSASEEGGGKTLFGMLTGSKGYGNPSPSAPLSDTNTVHAEVLMQHCHDVIGDPRVIQVNENVWVAVGYDLANTILIRTSEGDIIVDVAMSPIRARQVKQALYDAIPGGRNPMGTHSLIYTHSHIDHTGGGKAWIEDADPLDSYLPEGSLKRSTFLDGVDKLQNHTNTNSQGYGKYNQIHVYSTTEVIDHFFKQVGVFRSAEKIRGSRQYGQNVAISELGCIGIGARPDVDVVQQEFGFQMPTRTFRKYMSYHAGDEIVELYEAHGETHDMLFVWLPRTRTLLPGDNYYHAFPNLYTIRGTSPRPVKSWVNSLDMIRGMKPDYLVPSHTEPIIGSTAIADQLTIYRDAIQWVYTETVKGANAGLSIDELVNKVKLPAHLASNGALLETYGQVDWSVRAIYDANLGWFDGEAEDLYPLTPTALSLHLIDAMGGKDQLFDEVDHALKKKDGKWALYLIKMLENLPSGELNGTEKKVVEKLKVSALGEVAKNTYNSNGKGYLLQSALEILNGGTFKETKPKLDDQFVDNIPLSIIWDVLKTRLSLDDSVFDVHETVLFVLDGTKWYLTQRRGIIEIVQDEPLLGTPEPVGSLIMSEKTWKQVSLQKLSPVQALFTGDIKLEGSKMKILAWLQRIEKGA